MGFFACLTCLMMLHSCLHGAVMSSLGSRGSKRVKVFGDESSFLGSNMPGTSTNQAPLTRSVATSVSSAESGFRRASAMLIASLTPS